MPIDTSIYQNIKPVEIPSMLDSQQRAMNLSSLAMQQAHAAKQLDREDQEYKQKEAIQRMGAITKVVEPMFGKNTEQQRAMFPQIRQQVVSLGLAGEKDIPSEYDEGWVNRNLAIISQSKDYLDRQNSAMDVEVKKSQIAKNYADLKKSKYENNLPPENKEQINKLAGSNANKASITTQIDSTIAMLDDPKISEDQKLMQARQLIKTLNSVQGPDAVGAEEVKRLAGLLEFRMMPNFTEPGDIIGRTPISEFATQAKLTSRGMKEAMSGNQKLIDNLKTGRKMSMDVPSIDSIVKSGNPKFSDPLNQNAHAGNDVPVSRGPHGPFVVQKGIKYNWNPTTEKYE
jgi:hypothetical protein